MTAPTYEEYAIALATSDSLETLLFNVRSLSLGYCRGHISKDQLEKLLRASCSVETGLELGANDDETKISYLVCVASVLGINDLLFPESERSSPGD